MPEPVPKSGKPRTLNHAILSLLGARGAGLLLRIAASLIAAAIAGPDAVGFVAWTGIFSVYVIWLTGGVYCGAERLVPIRRAENRTAEVEAIWGMTTWVSMRAVAACVLLGGIAAAVVGPSDPLQGWKFACAGLLSGISLFTSYANAIFTGEKRLDYLNRTFFLGGILWWALLPLAWWSTPGLASRALLVAALPSVICLLMSRKYSRPVWHGATARTLAREGLPILLTQFLLLLSFSLDRTLISICMNDRDLGHYVIATSVISAMRLMQYAVNRVLVPNLGEMLGQGRSARDLARKTLPVLLPLLAMLVPATAVGWFLMEPLTRMLLPAFLHGVPAGRIALLGGSLIAVLGTSAYYNTLGRQKTLMAMLTAGLIVQACVSLALYRQHGTLESFAWGFAAGALTSALLVNGGILYTALRQRAPTVEAAKPSDLIPDPPTSVL